MVLIALTKHLSCIIIAEAQANTSGVRPTFGADCLIEETVIFKINYKRIAGKDAAIAVWQLILVIEVFLNVNYIAKTRLNARRIGPKRIA